VQKNCCIDLDNVFVKTDTDSPCSICPWDGFEVEPYNTWCHEHWRILDITGRDRGFAETPLREEAIDAHLRRYEANTPEVYETLINIETVLFSFRQGEKEKEEKRKEGGKQSAAKTAKKAKPQKRGTYKETPKRPTHRIK